ncbi:MAG: glycosyltransferase [Candidatus Rifleibacteriota bacterium]
MKGGIFFQDCASGKRPCLLIFLYSMAGGGSEKVVSNLLFEFAKEFRVHLVLMDRVFCYEIPEDVTIHSLGSSKDSETGLKKFLKIPWLSFKFTKLVKQIKPDFVISLMNRPNYIATLSSFFYKNYKLIVCERSMPSVYYSGNFPFAVVNRKLIEFLYPLADKILANSNGNAADLINKFRISGNKVSVILNPIDSELIKLRQAENYNSGEFRFVSVGRMDDGKNHSAMIQALKELPEYCSLHLIGDGPNRKKLESMVKALGICSRVTFHGKVFPPYEIMAKCHAFVFTSKYEGFPNVLIEAIACGLPVISTNCLSGPAELLLENPDDAHKLCNGKFIVGEYGVLIPVEDNIALVQGMKYILDNTTKRIELVKASKKQLKKFEMQSVLSKWRNLFFFGDEHYC